MGQGQEHKTRAEPQVQIQERGEIFFFYRPKVNKEEAHGIDDVQRLYIVLRPESGEKPVEEKQGGPTSNNNNGEEGTQEVNIEKETLFRFIVMGKKMLPDTTKKSHPYWGFVEMVTTKIQDVKAALAGEEYDTKTRGHRHKPSARAVGEGVYRILRHIGKKKNMHTHLIYKLEFPKEDDDNQQHRNEPQESLNIEKEGSFLIQVKNPDQGVGNKRKAVFPAHMQASFGHKRYCPADPPDLLNYQGCEFLLIAASDDIEEELGLELETEQEEADPSCSDLVKTFGEVASPAPLLKGTWD